MSLISDVQQGVIGQWEFVKLLILGSLGQIEVDEPTSDDERRDAEVHRKHRFRRSLAFQIKTARVLRRGNLVIRFNVAKANLFTDPGFWYFFAHLDLKAMAFTDPVFIVPSREVHKHARFGETETLLRFTFQASLAERSRDRWVPYRVLQKDAGTRVLEILTQLKAERGLLRAPKELETPPGVLWVGIKRS
jgi:hypothetical protein